MLGFDMTKRKSVTLIELIIILVIFGLVMPPFLLSLNTSTLKVIEAETMITSVIVGRSLLEEIISKRFDEYTDSRTTSSDFGAGKEDESANREDFDDIDDYDGFSESYGNGFNRSVDIYYVDPDVDLDTEQFYITNYKRVDVVVSHSLTVDEHFSFIMSSEY